VAPIAAPEPEKIVVEEKSNDSSVDESLQAGVASPIEIPVALPEVEQTVEKVKSDADSLNGKVEEAVNKVEALVMQPEVEQANQSEPDQAIIEIKSDVDNLHEPEQEEAPDRIAFPIAQLEVEQAIVEDKSNAESLDEQVEEEVAIPVKLQALEQVLAEEKGIVDGSEAINQEESISTIDAEIVLQDIEQSIVEVQEHPIPIVPEQQTQELHVQTEDTQKVRVPSFYVQPRLQAKQIEVPEAQVGHDDKSMHSEIQMPSPIEEQIQPIAEQWGGEQRSEEERGKAEAREKQPEPEVRQAQVEELAQPALQVETAEEKIEESEVHVKTKAEEVVEELERRANVRKRAEEELERQARARKQAEEDLDDQMLLNEETQKLPRVKMAQKYSSGRRPIGPNSTHDGMNGKSGKKG
jgi:hypothetical protein